MIVFMPVMFRKVLIRSFFTSAYHYDIGSIVDIITGLKQAAVTVSSKFVFVKAFIKTSILQITVAFGHRVGMRTRQRFLCEQCTKRDHAG